MKKRRLVSRSLAVIMALTMLGGNLSVVHATELDELPEEKIISDSASLDDIDLDGSIDDTEISEIVGKSSEDITAPELVSISVSSDSVEVPGSTEIIVYATDDISGVIQIDGRFTNKTTGKFIYFNGYEKDNTEDGKWYCKFETDEYSASGDYYIEYINVKDKAGNYAHLIGKGSSTYDYYLQNGSNDVSLFPEEYASLKISVDNNLNEDITAPELVSISVSSDSVEVPESTEIIVYATDDISGVIQIDGRFTNKTTGKFIYFNGYEKDNTEDGKWYCKFETDEYSASGDYYIEYINVKDKAGNYVRLIGKGSSTYDYYLQNGSNDVSLFPEDYASLKITVINEGKYSLIINSDNLIFANNYKEALLDNSDLNVLSSGVDIDCIFELEDITRRVSSDDQDLLDAEQGNGQNSLYLKLILQKKIDENEVQTVTETSEKIRVGIDLPDSLLNSNPDINRTYRILSLYNGVVTPIDASLEDKTLYFETDKFSIIAINVIDEYSDTNPFKLYALGVDDSEQFIASFNEWNDCSNYISSLGNAKTKYSVHITENVTIATGLTLPGNNAGIKFVGDGENNYAAIQTTGNIKLSSDTEFEKIDLMFINIDKQGNISANKKATIDLNGKKLSFKNTLISEDISSIKGSGASYFYAVDSGVLSAGDFSVSDCTLKGSQLYAKSINIANDLYMTSSEMISLTNISLRNLHSLDKKNRIRYATVKNNTFKINGIVDSVDEYGIDHGQNIEIGYASGIKRAWINSCAISVSNNYYEKENPPIEDTDGLLLLTGKAAPSAMFVVNRYTDQYDDHASTITAKQGEKIVVSTTADSNVLLYNVNADSSEVLLGNFANVNDAFSEITRLNNKNATYKILLNESTEAKDVNFPSALKKLTVEGKDNTIVWNYDKKISIKSDVTFNGVPVKSGAAAGGSIDIGAYNLTFVNSKMKLDSNITGVTGKGVLTLDGSILLVKGSINVGKIVEVGQSGAKIAAVAKITKDKNGNITNIEPGIVLTDGITAELSLTVGMLYVNDNKSVVPLRQTQEGLDYLDNNGIKMVKTAKGVTENVVFLWDSEDLVQNDGFYHNNNNGTSVIKQPNYLVYINRDIDEVPYTLFYDGNFVKFLKFSDAVAEINTLKNKNTSYTILLTGDANNEVNTKATAETLVMPAANNYKDLTIASDNLGDSVTLYYKSDKIIFTGDTTLRDVVLASAVDFAFGKEKPLNIAIPANKKLTIEGCVEIEERAVIIDGAKKGSLELDDAEFVAGISVMNTGNATVQGAIKNIHNLEITEGTELDVLPYLVNSKRAEPELSVTKISLVNNHIEVGDDISKTAKMSVDTLSVSDGSVVRVKGNLTTKTVNANEGLTGKYSLIFADTDTKITGDINLYSDKLVIRARQTAKELPYLTVSGNIVKKVDGAKLYVDLYENSNDVSVRPGNNTFEIKLMTAAKADTTLIGTVSDYDENSGAATPETYSVGTNPSGYIPAGNGNYVSLYDVNAIGCEAKADGTGIGYYTDLPKALSAIDARKDKNAEYEVILYKDAGSPNSVISLNLPSNARKVTVNGYSEEYVPVICYTDGITIKSDTVFGKVRLSPMTNKGVPAVLPIKAGNYNLSFDKTYFDGTLANSRISEITADKGTKICINPSRAFSINKIDTKGTLDIHTDLTVNGTADIATLNIFDGKTITLSKPVESIITDVFNKKGSSYQAGAIVFTRINEGLENETSALTINGHVYNDSSIEALELKIVSSSDSISYAVKDGAEFNAAKALFDAKYVETDEVKVYVGVDKYGQNGELLNDDIDSISQNNVISGDRGIVAKSSGNFYYMTGKILGNVVTLHNDNDLLRAPRQYYADFNQAISRINLDGNSGSAYTIYVGLNNLELTDTNLLDTIEHSVLAMPEQNKVGKLTVESGVVDGFNNPQNVDVYYSGNITAYGSPELTVAGSVERGGLFLNGITLHNVNSSNDNNGYAISSKTGTVSVFRNGFCETGCVDFVLNNSSFADTVNAINGTKSATNVVVGKDIILNQGFNNIAKLTIKPDVTVTSNGKSMVDEVYFMRNTSNYYAKGATTVGNIRIDLFDTVTPTGPSMLVSVDENKPQFTLTGSVTDSAGGSLNANSKLNLLVVNSGVTDIIGEAQLDIPFIKAAKADASSFMLKQNVVLANEGTLIAYKDKDSNVMFGSLNDMAIRVKRNPVPEKGFTAIDTYAKSWDDALAIVKSTSQESEYTFELIKDIRLDEAKKKISFPDAKAYTKLNVVGSNSENRKLFFTGDLSTTDAICFEHITLPNGISVTNGGAYDLSFGDGTCTAIKEGETYVDSGLAFNKVTVSNKAGSITINKKSDNTARQFVINSDTTVNGTLITEGKVELVPGAGKKFTVGDIIGIGGDDADFISIESYRSADKNSSPLMSINGNVKDVEEIHIRQRVYDSTAKTYYPCTSDDVLNMAYSDASKAPANAQKIINLPVSSGYVYKMDVYDALNTRWVEFDESANNLHFAKTQKVLVLTSLEDAVEVQGDEYLSTTFLSWSDAITEINNRADKNEHYKINILKDLGRDKDGNITTASLLKKFETPGAYKAAVVEIYGGYNDIYTNSVANITFNTDTVIWNDFRYFNLKADKNGYISNDINVTVGNGYELDWIYRDNRFLTDINDSYLEPANVRSYKGGSKSKLYTSYEGMVNIDDSVTGFGEWTIAGKTRVNVSKNVSVADLVIEDKAKLNYKGSVTASNKLEVYGGGIYAAENCTGNLTAKNTSLVDAELYAINMTLNGETKLKNSLLSTAAGTKAGQGKMTLANVTLLSDENNLIVKQDAKGNSMLTINGNVSRQDNNAVLIVALLYYKVLARLKPIQSDYVVLHNGMMIAVAPKCDADMISVNPKNYNVMSDVLGLYKSGKNINYGTR